MAAVDRAHVLAQRNLRAAVGATVGGMIRMVGLDRSEAVRGVYATATARTVTSGQRQAGRFALAYVAALAPPVHPPNLDRALDGILMRVEDPGAIVGLLRLWSLLDEDVDELDARAEAASYAGGLAESNLQGAVRAGLDEGADAAEREPRWRLEPSPGACAWCQSIADEGAIYPDADSVPVPHSAGGSRPGGPCGCSPAPEF